MSYSMSWSEAIEAIAKTYGSTAENVEAVLNQYDIYSDPQAALAHFRETQYIANAEKVRNLTASGKYVGSSARTITTTISNSTNSNTILKSQIRVPVSSKMSTVGSTTKFTAKVGLRQAGSFVFGEVLPAIAAAGWGITLGKTIDRALYNANPDFWNAHGMSTLNPDTWNSITSGYDGVAGTLFNLIFGLDGNKSQAYLDEDAAAYLALWLKEQGFFASGNIESTGDVIQGQTYTQNDIKLLTLREALQFFNYIGYEVPYTETLVNRYGDTKVILAGRTSGAYSDLTIIRAGGFTRGIDVIVPDFSAQVTSVSSDHTGTLNQTITLTSSEGMNTFYSLFVDSNGLLHQGSYGRYSFSKIRSCYPIIDNTDYATRPLVNYRIAESLDGVGDQDGATLPDTSDWNDLPSTKTSLQRQYPGLWNNAKNHDYVDDDGNNQSKTYIPINLPNVINKDDVHPTSGDRNQANPEVDPETALDDLLDTIAKTITTTPTGDIPTTPTGGGSSPTVTPPSGQASSLWAIYNPTQAQVESFGSWLWSSNMVDQIKKLFNDPMQAIIGIHKVFVSPDTNGTGNIKCGYIDSGVSANIVSSQYKTVDCGTVSLTEEYGNVFDYNPYTKVSIYLPFIGIVDLDVADIMRSKINVKYHVDVITGACLADVKVSRDGANSVLYQYSGSCIVSYPLSSGSYASAVAGVLAIAGGAVASIASGGALAPAAIGAAVGVTNLHSDVKKSGTFSGAAGAMGSKKPYLIISRPQTAMPSTYKNLKGQPTSKYIKLSNCSGFVKVDAVHVRNTTATDAEVLKIEALLKEGVEV